VRRAREWFCSTSQLARQENKPVYGLDKCIVETNSRVIPGSKIVAADKNKARDRL
jgi:hypothetical protein